jgi:hypothetical protein
MKDPRQPGNKVYGSLRKKRRFVVQIALNRRSFLCDYWSRHPMIFDCPFFIPHTPQWDTHTTFPIQTHTKKFCSSPSNKADSETKNNRPAKALKGKISRFVYTVFLLRFWLLLQRAWVTTCLLLQYKTLKWGSVTRCKLFFARVWTRQIRSTVRGQQWIVLPTHTIQISAPAPAIRKEG